MKMQSDGYKLEHKINITMFSLIIQIIFGINNKVKFL